MANLQAVRRRSKTIARAEDLKDVILECLCPYDDNEMQAMLFYDRTVGDQRHKTYEDRHLRETLGEIEQILRTYGQKRGLCIERINNAGEVADDYSTLFDFDSLSSDDLHKKHSAILGARLLHGSYNFSVTWIEVNRQWRVEFSTWNGPATSVSSHVRHLMSLERMAANFQATLDRAGHG